METKLADTQHKKWVNVILVLTAALLSFILFSLSVRFSSALDLETKIKNIEIILRLGSLAAGAVFFAVGLKHKQANEFLGEVVLELSRVSWPLPDETRSATLVVVIAVLISGMILGMYDYLWTKLVSAIL